MSVVKARILQEEENQDEDVYDPLRRVMLAPTVFICDNAGTMNVQAFAANSQSRVWSAHRTLYLPSTGRNFRKSMMDPRPIVHLTVCHPSAIDQREEFQTFLEFSGIKKELDPVSDESLKLPSDDWTGGKCSVALPLLKQMWFRSECPHFVAILNCVCAEGEVGRRFDQFPRICNGEMV